MYHHRLYEIRKAITFKNKLNSIGKVKLLGRKKGRKEGAREEGRNRERKKGRKGREEGKEERKG